MIAVAHRECRRMLDPLPDPSHPRSPDMVWARDLRARRAVSSGRVIGLSHRASSCLDIYDGGSIGVYRAEPATICSRRSVLSLVSRVENEAGRQSALLSTRRPAAPGGRSYRSRHESPSRPWSRDLGATAWPWMAMRPCPTDGVGRSTTAGRSSLRLPPRPRPHRRFDGGGQLLHAAVERVRADGREAHHEAVGPRAVAGVVGREGGDLDAARGGFAADGLVVGFGEVGDGVEAGADGAEAEGVAAPALGGGGQG